MWPWKRQKMNKCARCNNKRGVIERWFALDKEYCDECLYEMDQEIRERRIFPVRRQKDDNEGKS
ncbi:hypothetical protein EH228_07195 [Erwinia endophytica]|nr:hypothetical protein EH228_07195 [Erwinia endophytica]